MKFREWFMYRAERAGVHLGWKTIWKLYEAYHEKLMKNGDIFILIHGKEGLGKSTLSAHIAAWINPDDDQLSVFQKGLDDYLERITQLFEEYKEVKPNEWKPKCCVLDEGSIDLYNKDSLTRGNKNLAKLFFTQRFLSAAIIINIQDALRIDDIIRNHRAQVMLIVEKRGSAKYVAGPTISYICNIAKDKHIGVNAVTIQRNKFFDTYWNKTWPECWDKEEYDYWKMKVFGDLLQRIREGNKTKSAAEKNSYTTTEFADIMSFSRKHVANMCIAGQIPGAFKINTTWRIPKETVEKLQKAQKGVAKQ